MLCSISVAKQVRKAFLVSEALIYDTLESFRCTGPEQSSPVDSPPEGVIPIRHRVCPVQQELIHDSLLLSVYQNSCHPTLTAMPQAKHSVWGESL